MPRFTAALVASLPALAAGQTLRVDLLAPDSVLPGDAFDVVVRADFSESGLGDGARLAVFTAFFEAENAGFAGLRPAEPFASASPTFDLGFDDVLGRPAVVLQADEILLTDTGFEVGVPAPDGEADLFVLNMVAGDEGEASVSFVTDATPDVDTPIGASGVFVFLTLPDFDVTTAGFDVGPAAEAPRAEPAAGDPVPARLPLVGSFSVAVPVGQPAGGADFDGSGGVDVFDLIGFLVAFAGADPSADFNGDDATDVFDLVDFLVAFASA